ncbi:hypothetical protein M427DRAFT_135404 [Gonapodya prolifera JEL478]|uniref:Uncharacterized protein n=1 Tax=Gonapodya prolifera (strain JEL478) TaxID=1344416 RepID=A0A139AE45_GONPJ|nr:hypothetical protein M427DRAFT_135404 [Gonapodya prolifera JEL478]|eukprot:KXS14939.1 hypothetical protein M427DRAFT_135404 [Gonapodya prolifera JEL478]
MSNLHLDSAPEAGAFFPDEKRVPVRVYDGKRFVKFYKQHPISNSVVFLFLGLILAFMVTGLIFKFSVDDDNTTEVFKLLMVGINGTTFFVILFQKRESIRRSWTLIAFVLAVFVFFYGTLGFNANILGIRFTQAKARSMSNMDTGAMDDDDDGDNMPTSGTGKTMTGEEDDQNPYGFNSDFLTLGLTLLIDVVYLVLYFFFRTRTRRIILVTSALILLEVVMFVVAHFAGSDRGIDAVNLVVPVVTGALSVIFWTGCIVNDEQGQMFYDYYERLDLLGPEEKGSYGSGSA